MKNIQRQEETRNSTVSNRAMRSGGEDRVGKDLATFTLKEVEQSIPHRFERMVEAHPILTAVRSPSQSLSYSELNIRANQVAHMLLQEYGEGAQQVGLMSDDAIQMIVYLLGVLKAGKTYIALDPSFAPERLASMVEDSCASVVVTDSKHHGVLQHLTHRRTLLPDAGTTEETLSENNPKVSILPSDIAYIIYSSGSTGRPKGIMHSHRSILHNIKDYTNEFHIGHHDRLTLLHSFSFNTSAVDLFCAVLNGATVYPWNIRRHGFAGLARWLRQEEVSILIWVPTPFRELAQTLGSDLGFPSLRIVALGSEPVTIRDVEIFRRVCSDSCLLVNRLGTTETNNFRFYFVTKDTRIDRPLIPVGYSLPEKEVLLLDETGEKVGSGQIGEIAVVSRYLSPGYWRNPKLTADRFRPVAGNDSVRMYCTGDLGRMNSEGCLEHLGRMDFQVKIRGQRVEVAEIEMALLDLEDVKEAAVVARKNGNGEFRLVAYLVAKKGSAVTADELHRSLRARLNDYMIPSRFIWIDAMPLTETGKLDRKALPDPGKISTRSQSEADAPRSPIESYLVALWSDLLGVRGVGIRDNFFDLGGHSLLAIRMAEQLRIRFGESIPLALLLEASTIEQLAQRLEWADWEALWSSLVPMQPLGSRPTLFCVHAHRGEVLFYHPLVRRLGTDQPVYGLQAVGLDGRTPQHRRIEEMASHYITEIFRLQPTGPYFLLGYCRGAAIVFEMARQLQEMAKDVGLVGIIDSFAPGLQPFGTGIQQVQRRVRTLCRLNFGELSSYLRRLTGYHYNRVCQRLRGQAPDHRRIGRPHDIEPYCPSVYDGIVTLFRPSSVPVGWDADPFWGWAPLVTRGVQVYEVPGYYTSLLSEPSVVGLARQVRAAMDRAMR